MSSGIRVGLAVFATPFLIVVGYLFALFVWQARPVMLWTDALIYVLIISISMFALYASKKEHLRDPLRQVLRSKMGTASLMVLVLYVLVGLTDSIHFRMQAENGDANTEVHYAGEVLSVLDMVVTPIREQVEKTYSAPFATHQFEKETVELEDGRKSRLYPRLVFGGRHLDNPERELTDDLLKRGVTGIIYALVIWLLLCAIIVKMLVRHSRKSVTRVLGDMIKGRSDVPWHVVLFTLLVMIALIVLATVYGPHYHIFGTDKVGQDVFYQSIKSIRTGLVIGTLTTLIMLPFAVLLGIMAGYFKGWVDDVIQYVYTTLNSIPGVLLIAAAVLMMQVYIANNPDMFETDAERSDMKLLFLCIILGITSWTGLCRMLRGEALKLREVDYVQASVAFGVSHWKIILRHIQPNVMHIVLIAVVLDFSGLVLAEAVLSYIGIGVDPTMQSWGNMINSARLEMAREPVVWWSLLAAFVFMFTLVLAANLFSDAVRDAFDPRIRQR